MNRVLTTALRAVFPAVLAAGLIVAPADAQQPQPQPQQQGDVEEVPDQELETFAEAYLEVSEVRMELQNELQTAEDSEEANRIQQQADQEMRQVLEEHGITVQRYQEITQVLNADPEQREEFQAVLEEKEGGPPGT